MLRSLIILNTALLIVSCTGLQGSSASGQQSSTPGLGAVLTDAEQCRVALNTRPSTANLGFDMARVRLFNWNTQKNTDEDIAADLTRLSKGADLILLQESVRNSSAFANIDPAYHWSFSQGYKTTGVTTASRIAPLAQCSLTHYEPWLKSPKATNITEFALQGTDKTLLVINLHMINFSIGLDAMRAQLLQALSFVEQHEGPVIVSGDFNTWRKARRDFVVTAFEARGMKPVGYANDQRKRVFGYALDHTFVRDINTAFGTSHSVSTSDHNPMSVTLEF